jgi:hypothetical protein
MKGYKAHIIWAIVAVIALIGGVLWGKTMAPTATTGRGAFGLSSSTRGGFGGRTGSGGGFVAGQVSAIDPQSITLQLPNGNSENVYYSSSTQVVIPQTTSISSVQTGDMVMIGGTQNSDGSMTATTIQVRNGGAGGGPGGTGGYGGGNGQSGSGSGQTGQ